MAAPLARPIQLNEKNAYTAFVALIQSAPVRVTDMICQDYELMAVETISYDIDPEMIDNLARRAARSSGRKKGVGTEAIIKAGIDVYCNTKPRPRYFGHISVPQHDKTVLQDACTNGLTLTSGKGTHQLAPLEPCWDVGITLVEVIRRQALVYQAAFFPRKSAWATMVAGFKHAAAWLTAPLHAPAPTSTMTPSHRAAPAHHEMA